MSQSWKLEVTGEPRGKWTSNGVRLPTYDDAVMYKFDLFCRWSGIGEARVVPSDDLPNYQWVNGRIAPMKPGDVA
jgi:hypothetical protein